MLKGGVIAIFGGAFDPVHFGHIKPIFQLLQHEEIERVVFVPCRLHPNKGRIGDTHIHDKHRLAMLGLLVRGDDMTVDMREMHAQEISYTVDTLRDFRAELGENTPLAFIMGEDAFAGVCGWNDYQKLLDLAHLIVIRRPNCAVTSAHHPLLEVSGGYTPLAGLVQQSAGKVCRFDNDPVAASSTEVREQLDRGEQPRYLIPGAVWSYIRRNRLYGFNDN